MSGHPLRSKRLRLSVGGAADLVVELDVDHAAADEALPRPTLLALDPDQAATGRLRAEVVVDGWRFEVVAEDARTAELRERALRAAAEHGVSVRHVVRAQIPGRITRLWVRPGDHVESGQRLLAIEAMKMENEIRALRAGLVESVAVAEGDRVELNAELLALA